MRYWWVNQKQTWRHEIGGGFMWSPKRSQNGRRNPFYEYMRIARPDDIVFSFVDSQVFAVGIVQSTAFESPKPEVFGSTGGYWGYAGWRVNVVYHKLPQPFRPRDDMDLLGPLQPPHHAPLRENGLGKANIYLTPVPEAMALQLAQLADTQTLHLVRGIVGREAADTNLISGLEVREQWENELEEQIVHRTHIGPTDREALVRARRGQGVFRSNLLQIEHACRVSHVANSDYLIAIGRNEEVDGD